MIKNSGTGGGGGVPGIGIKEGQYGGADVEDYLG